MTVKEYNISVDEYSDNLFRFALKHLRNEMSANDVVQETFTKVWIKHEEVSYEKVKSYLFTTAYHAIVDWVKKEGRSGDIENTEEQGENSNFNFNLKEVLDEALDKLPKIQKSVVLLRDYEGYNYDEIAEITGLSESQVKVYIFRARKALKTYIKRLDLVI
ncbi:MAG: RNA polymerase sigma factor (sigma-70 family) [Crocinitomicaceae bacterium]|jgi:RNA polymerase sigma factor (sigma-70 family)